ncbi:diguanylate cyclase [uncultured Pseudodesulfovibrio sp.]|uniref:diguanylate cyclase n=1 Tax=uncultured Pseudodesulfovibrio sp. TaxID=2035858 RepID=UPI0029C61F97|nr:diguanylate cyclase [uncultured Pseudodesulfovibrio sp.]
MADSPTVLLVEDSKFFASMLHRRIREDLDFNVEWKATYADAVAAIDCCQDDYLVAVLDVTLPDAPNGEIVEYALKKGIPSILFTAGFDSAIRSQFITWNIVDYILKDSGDCVDTLIHTLTRIRKNRDIKTLVVDDSKPIREAVAQLLGTQLYQVFTASDGEEALHVLEEHPDIMLVVTDYDMPNMDGFELIRRIRERYSKNDLAIIGMSAGGEELLSAKLIKTGANDFVPKPFQVEEFHCRVGHSIEMLENIALIRDLSYKDPLTRLYNRRYFFENAEPFISHAQKHGNRYCVAMLDIDHFKNVNDTYGHDAGDEVLKNVSALIAQGFPERAIVTRFGGEEFCVLTAHDESEDILGKFEAVRATVEATSVTVNGSTIEVTISTGLCCEPENLEAMLKLSDSRLYAAKESGRNRVVASPASPNVRS